MSAAINSPHAGETVTSLTVTVSVSYDTTIGIGPGAAKAGGSTTVAWQLTCSFGNASPQTRTVLDGQGTEQFTFVMAAPGNYAAGAQLNEATTTNGVTVTTPHGSDTQDPIHVTNGGAVVLTLPPLSGPTPPGPESPAAAAGAAAPAAAVPACPSEGPVEAAARKLAAAAIAAVQPIILHGQILTTPASPVIGVLCELYHVDIDTRLVTVDYIEVAQIFDDNWSVVFDPAARGVDRHYRLRVLGVLGRIILTTSSCLPP